MQHRSVPCPAAHHATNLGMIGTVIGMGMANAAVNGALAVRQAREVSASQTLAFQLRQAVESAHHWSDIACAQAAEIEKLKADNERLRRVAKAHHDTAQALARRTV